MKLAHLHLDRDQATPYHVATCTMCGHSVLVAREAPSFPSYWRAFVEIHAECMASQPLTPEEASWLHQALNLAGLS